MITEKGLRWLCLFADHASVAIANARAFEEIDRLRKQLEMENSYLREEFKAELAFGEIVGQSAAMKRILHQIDTVAPTEASVLILGETGTGKELVARAIHDRSHRPERPMIKVNCGAVPRELFESEFFSHIKGAFTGAIRDRSAPPADRARPLMHITATLFCCEWRFVGDECFRIVFSVEPLGKGANAVRWIVVVAAVEAAATSLVLILSPSLFGWLILGAELSEAGRRSAGLQE